MTVMLLAAEDTGGIPVAPGGEAGALVEQSGQLQFGEMLLGAGTSAGWRELVGWRDAPPAQVSDSPRPQADGAYPGDVYADSLVVTYTFLLRGTPQAKAAALATLESYAPQDGVERVLAVNDVDDGVWFRLARVIGRHVPQGKHYQHGPLECSLQFLCADPRRYSLTEQSGEVTLPASSGGLEYPLVYPLEYGTSAVGSLSVTNSGSTPTPTVARFQGPLTDPVLSSPDWSMGFDLTLADGDELTVDTSMGTALLNGAADRLYTIRTDSDPLERCLLPRGTTELSLTATAGTGRVVVTYRDARM